MELTMADVSEQCHKIIRNEPSSKKYLMTYYATILYNGDVVKTFDGKFLFNNTDVKDILYADHTIVVLLDIANNIIVYRKTGNDYEKTILVKNVWMIKQLRVTEGMMYYIKYGEYDLLLRIDELIIPEWNIDQSVLEIYELYHVGDIVEKPRDNYSKVILIDEKCLDKTINGHILCFNGGYVEVLSDDMICYKINEHNGILSSITEVKLSITGPVYLSDDYMLYSENNTIKIKSYLMGYWGDGLPVRLKDFDHSDIKNAVVDYDGTGAIVTPVIITENELFLAEILNNDDKYILDRALNLNGIKYEMIYCDRRNHMICMYYFENDELCTATVDLESREGFKHKNIGIHKGDIKERPIVRRAKSARSMV